MCVLVPLSACNVGDTWLSSFFFCKNGGRNLRSRRPVQTIPSDKICRNPRCSPRIKTPNDVANSTRERSIIPYKLTGSFFSELKPHIHARKIANDFIAIRTKNFASSPPAFGACGSTNTNESRVYATRTSITEFLSIAFFFAISRSPLRML